MWSIPPQAEHAVPHALTSQCLSPTRVPGTGLVPRSGDEHGHGRGPVEARGLARQTITKRRTANSQESEGKTHGVFIKESYSANHGSFQGSVKDFPKEATFGLSLMHERKLTTRVQAKSTGCMQVLWCEARGLWSVRLQKGEGGAGRERMRLETQAGGRSCGLRNFSEGTKCLKPPESGVGGGA